LQIAIYKNGQIIAILQIIKNTLYREFLKFIKTAKLLQFWKLFKFPSIGIFEIYKYGQIIAILQIAIYKNGQIIAILPNIKIPLYRDF
jgi:hypothetical protein